METKISVIKEELQAASYKELPLFISKYETDERSGVAALVKKRVSRSTIMRRSCCVPKE